MANKKMSVFVTPDNKSYDIDAKFLGGQLPIYYATADELNGHTHNLYTTTTTPFTEIKLDSNDPTKLVIRHGVRTINISGVTTVPLENMQYTAKNGEILTTADNKSFECIGGK